jgi:non-specific serine/threonine protein kinase
MCALTFSELGAVAAAQRRPERAARLLGAAEGIFERLGMRLAPARSRVHADALATTRSLLGPARVAAALAAGRALPFDEVVAEALAEVRAAPGRAMSAVGAGPDGLTSRELEVLQLLARGLTSKEIAAALVVSVRTVEHHRASVLAKIGARSRAEVVAYAAQRGWAVDR